MCGLGVHKDSFYATVMSYGGEVIERKRLSHDEVVGFLGRCELLQDIDKVAMESSTSVLPVCIALRGKGYEILG